MLPIVRLGPLPTADANARSPGGEMMIDEVAVRGGDIASLGADPELFGRLLRATGGLPLAIQLTANHVVRFGVRFAAEQPAPLDEIIHDCIDRTLALLTDEDRLVFERLGLTAGTFTLDVIGACLEQRRPAPHSA